MTCDYEAAAKGARSGCPTAGPTWLDGFVEFSAAHHLLGIAVVLCVLAGAYAVWAVGGARITGAVRARNGKAPVAEPAPVTGGDAGSAHTEVLGVLVLLGLWVAAVAGLLLSIGGAGVTAP